MVECQPSKLNTWVRFPSPAFFAQIAQSVEQRTENPRVTGSIPVLGICHTCASGRVVLCLLAKEKVAGSIPVSRSLRKERSLILQASFLYASDIHSIPRLNQGTLYSLICKCLLFRLATFLYLTVLSKKATELHRGATSFSIFREAS